MVAALLKRALRVFSFHARFEDCSPLHLRTRSQPTDGMVAKRRVATAVATALLTSVHEKCADGSDPASNGCCADTNVSPPDCLGRYFKQTCLGSDPGCRTCQCYGCCTGNDDITMNADCTFSGCESFVTFSLGDTYKAATSQNGCTTCVGERETSFVFPILRRSRRA